MPEFSLDRLVNELPIQPLPNPSDSEFFSPPEQEAFYYGVASGIQAFRKNMGTLYPEAPEANQAHLQLILAHEVNRVAMEAEKLKLSEVARRDPLTGLYNRAVLEETFSSMQRSRLHSQARRSADISPNDGKQSLILIDVDNFKSVNDENGHLTGDLLLRALAKKVKGTIRGSDVAVRYGGEEIVIMLPRAAEITALRIAEKIRLAIGETSVGNDSDELISRTASIGVAEIDLTETLNHNLKKADRAMYEAKRNGKNQCVSYSGVSRE